MIRAVTVFHLCVFVLFLWGAYQDCQIISGPGLPIKGNYFSKIVWLTIIDLYIQIFYHLYSAYLSTRSDSEKRSAKKYHFLSNAVVFPAAFSVGFMFWGLYLISPELLIPKGFKNPLHVHPIFNHHSLPAIAMFLDCILWNHGKTSRKKAMIVMTLFICLYIADIHVMHAYSGFWPYGILGMLSLIPRIIFLLGGGILMYTFFFVGEFLRNIFHPVKTKSRRH